MAEFGLNALGVIVAVVVIWYVAAVAFGMFAALMDALTNWADRNGWN